MNTELQEILPAEKPHTIDALDDHLTQSLQAPKLDPIFLAVANDYLGSQSIPEIANNYGVSPDRITQILEKKEVRAYVNQVYLTQGYLNRNKRLSLINKIIDKKLEEALETNVWSKVDIFYFFKHLQEMENALSPKKSETPTVAVQINNNYEQLIRDITSKTD